MLTSILKSTSSPKNTSHSTTFIKGGATFECETTDLIIDNAVVIKDGELVINDAYFDVSPTTFIVPPSHIDTYKHKKGKTMKNTPQVSTRVIIIPKDAKPEGPTIAERWKLIVKEAEQFCTDNGVRPSHTQCRVITMSIINWKEFEELIARHTLISKPQEFDGWMGKLWINQYGLRAPRLEENDDDDEDIITLWKIAKTNSLRYTNRCSLIKQTADYWNKKYIWTVKIAT